MSLPAPLECPFTGYPHEGFVQVQHVAERNFIIVIDAAAVQAAAEAVQKKSGC